MNAPFEHASKVRDALRAITADPALGPEPLANAQTAANLLQDLLPDAPRETSLLLAAIAAGSPTMLREHISHGMAGGTAIGLTAAALANRTAFTPEACQWALACTRPCRERRRTIAAHLVDGRAARQTP